MDDASRITVHGRNLRCQHCGHQHFHHKTASLDQVSLGGLFHWEGWWGLETAIYVCARCGFAHFFMPVPEAEHQIGEKVPEVQPRSREGLTDEACLSCGKVIPAEADQCPACGWSWADQEERG